eukprot:SAG31_NODE_4656_length_3065_cov_13.806136_1_plen_180_part_00
MKATLKPPGHVSAQSWHQDSFYITEASPRPTGATSVVPPFATMLIYLDPTEPGAGATAVASGTHYGQDGLHGGLHTSENERRNYRGGLTVDAVEAAGSVLQPRMAPGDCMVIHANVAHSVGDNKTARTRAALAHVYKSAESKDIEPGDGNTRSWAELPVARHNLLAFLLGPTLLGAASL